MKPNQLLSILRGATFVFLCRVAGAGLAFVSQIVLARSMGADQLGVYVFAFSLSILLTTVSGLGFPAAAIRFIGASLAKERGDLVLGFVRRTVQIFAGAGLVIAGIGVTLVITIDGLVDDERRSAVILAILLVPVFGQLVSRTGVAIGLSWLRPGFLPNMVFRPLLFLIFIAVSWYLAVPLAADGAMLLQLLSVSLVTLAVILVMRRKLKSEFPETRPAYETSLWVRTALPLLMISVFTNYFMELNLFIAGTHLEAGDLAVFNASFRTAALIAFGLYAVDAVTMPQISRFHAASDKKALRTTIIRASRLRFWGAVVAMVPLIWLGRPILGLFGEQFVDGYDALLILAASQVLSAALGPTARLLSVTGYQDQCLRVFLFSLIATIVLHAILIDQFGLNGAALAVFTVVLLQSIWLYILVVHHLGVHTWAFAPIRAED